jgi:tetratricopeptide (TPR) repeat protein
MRRALESNPDLAEARIRLGHVLLQRERPGEALEALGNVVERTADPVLRYYARLVTGAAERARGNADGAVEAYKKAAALYPRAQSPHLALSQLARERGDRGAALEAAQRVLSLPGDERERLDPWWDYHRGTGRRVEALLIEVRTTVGGRQ